MRARAHAGQQSTHTRGTAQGAGRVCGKARSQLAQKRGSRNVTTFCRGELGRVLEQQRRHAGQQSVHAAECAQGAGRGSVPGAGMSVKLVDRPRSLGNVRRTNPAACQRPLRAPLRRRQSFGAPRQHGPGTTIFSGWLTGQDKPSGELVQKWPLFRQDWLVGSPRCLRRAGGGAAVRRGGDTFGDLCDGRGVAERSWVGGWDLLASFNLVLWCF
jgi:hypothetical protein